MKINFRRYLYMFSVALLINIIYELNDIFFIMPYSGGGIKQFVEFNETLPFVQIITDNIIILASVPIMFIEIIPYFIIIFCGIKMVKYVNSHTGLDQNMKTLSKQLTKTLIILTLVPFVKHATILILSLFIQTNSNTANIVRLIINHWFHFTPVFNAIICILTNKPYRNAVFKSIRIFPQ
ncbi:unnamed protein product [Meloidogyne enterolobii]|uniref:Uncharacterized protein n=1 Tax=Meloidogyne enterolobii TaxID=390850 RepID=A0ACB0ZEC9_MELEN